MRLFEPIHLLSCASINKIIERIKRCGKRRKFSLSTSLIPIEWEKAKMLLDGYERKIEKSFAENYEEDYRIGLIEKYVSDKSRVCLAEIWQKAIYTSYAPKFPTMRRSDANEIAHILVDVLGYDRGYAENFGEYGKQKSYYKEIDKND